MSEAPSYPTPQNVAVDGEVISSFSGYSCKLHRHPLLILSLCSFKHWRRSSSLASLISASTSCIASRAFYSCSAKLRVLRDDVSSSQSSWEIDWAARFEATLFLADIVFGLVEPGQGSHFL